jgi:hypothetical protein
MGADRIESHISKDPDDHIREHQVRTGQPALKPRCHPDSPVWTVYQAGLLRIECATCNTEVATFKVATSLGTPNLDPAWQAELDSALELLQDQADDPGHPSFEELFRAANHRDPSVSERLICSLMPQQDRNTLVRWLVEQAGGKFRCEDRTDSNGTVHTEFWRQ